MSQFERVERGYHSLSKIEEVTPRVKLSLNLPEYIDQDKIKVNVRQLHRMMRMGGISTITVVGQSGEIESTTPSLVGHSPDGTGYAGNKTIVKKVPTSVSSRERQGDIDQPLFTAGRWTDATVTINLSQLQDKLSQEGKLRSPQAWAKELDQAMKEGVAQEGIKHLTLDSASYISFVLATSFGTLLGTDGVVHGTLANNLYYHVMYNVINRIRYKWNDYDTDGYRWSLIAGPQLDRALILKGMEKAGKVVRVFPEKKL